MLLRRSHFQCGPSKSMALWIIATLLLTGSSLSSADEHCAPLAAGASIHAQTSVTPLLRSPYEGHSVYVDVENDTPYRDFDHLDGFEALLKSKGYRLMNTPDSADVAFTLRVAHVDHGSISEASVVSQHGQASRGISLDAPLNASSYSTMGGGGVNRIGGANSLSGNADFASGALHRATQYTVVADATIRPHRSESPQGGHAALSATASFHAVTQVSGQDVSWDEGQQAAKHSLCKSLGALFANHGQ